MGIGGILGTGVAFYTIAEILNPPRKKKKYKNKYRKNYRRKNA